MISSDVKQVEQEFEMADVDRRFVYKNVCGYLVSLFAEDERRVLVVNAYLPEDNGEKVLEEINKIIDRINFENGQRLIGYKYENGEFEFSFKPSNDAYYHVGGFLQEFTSELKEMGVHGVTHCWHCHKPLQKGDRMLIEYNASAKNVHSECEDEIREESAGKVQDRNLLMRTRKKGRIGAVTAAFAGMLFWSVVYALDLPFHLGALVGLAVGYAVKKLYDMRGGIGGGYKIATVTVTNAVAILLGTVLGFITKYSRAANKGLVEKIKFIKMFPLVPGDMYENRLTLLIGFVLSLVICYDVFLSGGKIQEEDEAIPLFRHLRSY